jgi:hypothetical protein
MPWLSRNDFTPTDKLHADDLNNLANDQRTWGGDVNGGGYTLSNVNIVAVNPQAGGGGSVFSVFGRNGDVVAQAGDYTAAQVGAVPLARQVIAGPGLSGGGPLSADVTLTAAVQSFNTRVGAITLTSNDITAASGVLVTRRINTAAGSGLQNGGPLSTDLNLSVVPDSSNQQVQIMSQGNPIGSPRHAINFISGTGALVTVSEISASNRIDVTVASTGTGGFVDPTQTLGDIIVRGLSAPATRLAVGSDGQVLTADHLQTLGVKWATPTIPQVTTVFGRIGAIVASPGDYSASQVTNAVDQTVAYNNPPWITSLPWAKITNPPAFMADPTVAKGDMIVHSASGTTNIPLGADGSVLTADSAMNRGIKWAALPVTSVFGRVGGAIVAANGDYDVSQVTNAVSVTTTINAGLGLQGGGNLSLNRTLSVVADTTNQRVQILKEGALIGQPRPSLNFHSGAGVALTIQDSGINNWVDITVASSGTGTGGGMVDPTSNIGDIIVRDAALPSPPVQFPIGSNGQVLTVDLSQPAHIKWATPAAGGAGSQTPWLGPIDAANNNLSNVKSIGLNAAAAPTTARVYAIVSGTEQAFEGVVTAAANAASIALLNDVNDSISLKSYGTGYVGGFPGILTIEATKALAVIASGAEVMRLTTGRVLIGTTADDGANMVQVNGKIKSKTGGFVFPDNSIQTTAYTSGSSPVTSVFTRTGAIVAVAGDYTAALVTNAVDSSSTYNDPVWITSLAWSKITGAPALLVDPTSAKGDLIARGSAGPATRLPVGANNFVLTADSSQALGVKWASLAQSPWTSDIDAAGHMLFNVSKIGIGTSSPSGPLTVVGPDGTPGTGAGTAEITGGDQAHQTRIGYSKTGNYGWVQASDSSVFTTLALNGAGGSVGIGTVAPATTLEISADVVRQLYLTSSSSPATKRMLIGYDVSNNTAVVEGFQSGVGVPLLLNPSGGHVGVGVTSPSTSNGGVGRILEVGTRTDTTSVLVLSSQAASASQHGGTVEARLTQAVTGDVRLGQLGWARVADVTAGKISSFFSLYTNNDGSLVSAFQVNPNGSAFFGVALGVATSQPTHPLHVLTVAATPNISNTAIYIQRNVGSSFAGIGISGVIAVHPILYSPTSTDDWAFGFDNGSNVHEAMRIASNGNVGIGTTGTPAAALTVYSSAAAGGPAASGATDSAVQVRFYAGNVGTTVDYGVNGSGVCWFQNRALSSFSTNYPMALNPNGGYVGCGTMLPGAPFQVNLNGSGADTPGGGIILSRLWDGSNIRGGCIFNYYSSGFGRDCLAFAVKDTTGNPWAIDSGIKMLITATGQVTIGTRTPTGTVTIIPTTSPTTIAGTTQLQIGEASDNASYRMSLGMGAIVGGSGWCSVIQCTPIGLPLLLQPNGGNVAINKGTGGGAYALDVTGDINATGAIRINGTAINPSGGIAGISIQINNGSNQPGPFTWLNFYAMAGIAITWGGASGPGNNTATIQIGTSSDIRLKRNVETLSGGLPLITQLRPITAEWNGLANTREGERLTSVIAQELQTVIPDAVYKYRTKLRDEDEDAAELLGIDPMALTCHLILAIQQLEARLKILEQKVN